MRLHVHACISPQSLQFRITCINKYKSMFTTWPHLGRQICIPLYFTVTHLTKEYAGKKKLLSGVCHRLVNIGVEIDHLSHRIREKRHLLDNRRLQNREVIERYEELNQQLNSYLNNVLHTQQQVPVEEVQPEITAV